MKKTIFSIGIFSMIFLVSCGGDKDKVETTDAKESAVAGEGSQVFNVNPNTSSTTWRGFKIYEDTQKEEGHYGSVKLKSGSVTMNDGVLESGNFVVDQTSFESADLNESPEDKAKLDGHLKSSDFLDVEKFPEAKFEITSVSPLDSGDYNSEISGNLDFRGVPKNIKFKANVKEEGNKVSIKSEEFKINRQDFGITFKGGGGSIIKDDVILQVDINAEK